MFGIWGFFYSSRIIFSEYLGYQALNVYSNKPYEAQKIMIKAYDFNPYFDKNLRQLIFIQGELIRSKVLSNQDLEIKQYANYLQELSWRNQYDIENLKTLTAGYMRYASFTHSSHGKALAFGKKLVTLDSTSPGSWDTLGLVYLDNQDYQLALQTFSYIVTELKPDYAFAYFHLGETYKQIGQKDKAKQAYQKAITLGYARALEEIEKLTY